MFSVPEESLRRYQPLKEIWMVDKARELVVGLARCPILHSYIRHHGRVTFAVCSVHFSQSTPMSDDDEVKMMMKMMMMCLDG